MLGIVATIAACAVVASVAQAVVILRQRRQLARLPRLAEHLRSLEQVCLTELGRGLEALRRDDSSVRVAPATKPLPVGDGAVGEIERTFNDMLAKAQGGLAAYNDVADRTAQTMHRMDDVSAMLEALRSNCLADLASALTAFGDGDLLQRVTPRTSPVATDRDDVAVVRRLVETANGMLSHVQVGVETYNRVADSQAELIARLVEVAGSLSGASRDLASSATEVSHGTEEIARSTSGLAAGAEQQVRSLSEASVAAGEADSTAREARELSRQGLDSVTSASGAMTELQQSSGVVRDAMRDLAEKTNRIGTIVDSITGIADQTTLLALNAAIEAARAGEHGRGFAVVADEVRKLAEEAQHAAGDIATILTQIREETAQASGLVDTTVTNAAEGADHVGSAMDQLQRITESIDAVTERVDAIARSTADVTDVARESSVATEQVAAATEEATASMEEVSAASLQLAEASTELMTLTARFRTTADEPALRLAA